MFERVKIAPSILSADFMNMAADIKRIEEGGANFVHVDVMDGHFVPNLTLGVPFVSQLKKISALPIDVHLMIDNPLEQLPWFIEAGADYLTVHIEAFTNEDQVYRAIELIRSADIHPAIALKPDTPITQIKPFISLLDMVLVMSVYPGFSGQSYIEGSDKRVAELVNIARNAKVSPLIEVDGGIGVATAKKVVDAGADVLVAGNAVFGAANIAEAIAAIENAAL